MFANIKDNNVRNLYLRLESDEYWDFMLFKGECYGKGTGLTTDCLASHIDLGNPACIGTDGKLYSAISWTGATNDTGVTLSNIGLTGVDNGLINYDKYDISKKDFLKLFLESKIEIKPNDTRFFLSPISGNTQKYSYDYEMVESGDSKYVALQGGFYQGFYKLHGFDYQTLPNTIDSDWHFEFTLRRRSDYETAKNTVNNTHPENAGMFFYLGTRAENKFNEIYKGTDSNGNFTLNEYDNGDYFDDILKKDEDIDLNKIDIITSNGHSADEQGYYSFETDNKHLFFDCTKTGFTTTTWKGDSVLFEGQNRNYIDNPFLLYNCTRTGHTIKDYDEITVPGNSADAVKNTSMTKGLAGNAFGLRITDDGAIEYRYSNCDEVNGGLKTFTESTLSGLVPDNQWVTINIRIGALNGHMDACGNSTPRVGRKMKMYIYVDGYLVFVSKELPMFNFRAFDEVPDKQEGVPYNISIGGGTQGLMDRIWLNYMAYPTEVYELERNYAGTFIGDIKSFKMYDCSMSIGNIRQNNIYEKTFLL